MRLSRRRAVAITTAGQRRRRRRRARSLSRDRSARPATAPPRRAARSRAFFGMAEARFAETIRAYRDQETAEPGDAEHREPPRRRGDRRARALFRHRRQTLVTRGELPCPASHAAASLRSPALRSLLSPLFAPRVFGQAKPKLVVIGGGPGGGTVARHVNKEAAGAIDVTLIEPQTTFSPPASSPISASAAFAASIRSPTTTTRWRARACGSSTSGRA